MQCTLVKTSETLKELAPSIIRIVCYTEGGGSKFFQKLALATRLHFKEHRFVVRFQPVVIQMFELCSAICSSCVVLCACVHMCARAHTHTHTM
jgi:hypothetical protein